MKRPSTKTELVGAIEDLVDAFMADVRMSAREAIEHAFSRASAKGQKRIAKVSTKSSAAARRTDAQVSQMCDDIFEVLRANPGVPMAVLVEKMNVPGRLLNYPMARLKFSGRIRKVGRRQSTRYYPVIGRSSPMKD